MKKWLFMLLTVVLMYSVAVAEVPPAAQGLIPDTARMVEMDRDDGVTEYEYRDGDTRYELKLRGDALLMLETVNPPMTAVPAATDEALVAELVKLLPEAVSEGVYARKDDGRQSRVVFLRQGTELFQFVTDTETSQVRSITRFFDAAEVLSVAQVWQLVTDAKGPAQLVNIQLEYDDGRLLYTGDATLDGKRYEFELLAHDGKLREWDRD